MNNDKTIDATRQAVRHLIVCDTQFAWNGSTTLKLQEMLDLQARGWIAEGEDNMEFNLTEAGEEVVARALEHGAPATLATVKHGGCVQLGDGLPPLPKTGYVTGGDFGHEAHNAFTPEQMQEYARAAIAAALSAQPSPASSFDLEAMLAACVPGGSIVDPQVIADNIRQWFAAQPSPGGQGDALHEAVGRIFGCDGSPWRTRDVAAVLRDYAALAARQPVAQEPVVVEAVATIKRDGDGELYVDWLTEGGIHDLPVGDVLLAANSPITNDEGYGEVYAAPPAQAVDLAAEPMFYIQDTRQLVGNCPMWWGPNGRGYVTRLDEAGRYTEQEAIKQNRTRDTDIPWPCAEIDAIARHTVDFQHMRPRAERLAELALTDSQAVGNG